MIWVNYTLHNDFYGLILVEGLLDLLYFPFYLLGCRDFFILLDLAGFLLVALLVRLNFLKEALEGLSVGLGWLLAIACLSFVRLLLDGC